MKRSFTVIAFITILILSACSTMRLSPAATQAPALSYGKGGGAPSLQEAPAAAPAPFLNDAAKSAAQNSVVSTTGETAPSSNRLVIQTAELTIVVKDVNARAAAIQNMATQMGGFVVSANNYQTYASDGTQVPQADVVVRVPADQLEAALTQIKQGTVDVKSETRSGQDVTDQYVDLQSRLTAKQAAEDQLIKIMQNATRTQDVLDVYQQLQQVESDIEVLKGQIKYYEQSAALSAITVHIVAEETVKPLQVGGWKPQGVARDAIQSLIFFWQGFINFLITFFLLVLPVLITIAIPIFLVALLLRWIFRKIWKPKAKAVMQVQENKN
ncbi:MAG: DUF4349 domain-containing protein [Chloroflexi bacterium]|nr:DUF4349 domain-containing protein [Chloroflexota bacterium]